MQAWDQVSVKKDGSDYFDQAGLVVRTKGDQITVKMDTDGAEVAFVESDLQLLGR